MMAVRNISAIGRTKPIPVYVWIPPTYGSLFKIEITRSDGTIDNITNIILSGEISEGINNTIGVFGFVVDNSSENYKDAWTGNNIVKVYIDYSTSATTLRFRGRIDKVSYQNNTIKIIGRSESVKLLGINVHGWGLDAETSVVLKALFDYYATDFTYTNVNVSTSTITANWYQKPFLECIQELCDAAGFDFYIDSSLDVHFFESGSVKNTTEAVVHGSNIFSIDDFGQDYSLIKNRVIVEGKEIGGLPLLYTSESTDPNYGITSALGVRELVIKDENVITITQAQERADYELNLALNPSTLGEGECVGLATLQPGEQVRISAPNSNLPPAYYTIVGYKHKFEGMMKTILTINKSPETIPRLIKERIIKEKDLSQISNPYALKYSWNFDFSTDTGTHSNTVIVEGVLRTDGSASGVWESEILEISSNLTVIELRVNGTILSGTKIYLSADGGVTYTQVGGVGSSLTAPAGKKLKLRVNLASANTQINGLALLYK